MPTKHMLSGGRKLIVVGVFAIAHAISSNSIQAQISSGALEAPATTSCVPPPSGLVSWWTAEGNGNDLVNSNNGALLNGAGFAGGKVGQAFNFNGSGAHVRIKDEPNLRFTGTLTIETWVNPANTSVDHQIVSKWDAIVGINQRCYGMSIFGDGRAYLGISTDGLHQSGTTAEAFSVSTVPTNQWTHIVGTYDGTAIKIYLNGVLEGTTPLIGSIFPGTNDLAIGGVVGGLGFGDLIRPFDGLIDEVSLYNRALSAAEIQAIYSAGSAGKCTGPSLPCAPPPSGIISFWPAEGNPQDLVGGNGGVPLSGATFAAGKVGQAFSFNGSGAHVRVKDAPNLHVRTNFTLESWFFRQGTGPAIQAILDKWDAAPGFNQRSYGISLHDNLATFGGSSDGVNADGVIQSTTTIPTNQWIHMVGTYDGATMKLYLNGVLNNSAGFTKGFFPGTNDFAIGGEVGGLPPGSAISTFQGLIDEPTIYSRALSSNEVLAIYNAGAGGKCRVPVPPVITSQPAGRTVPAGTNVTFNVAVIGATPLNYQWKFNGSNILGATNVSLTLSNVQVSTAGNYSVFVSNTAGATNSSNAVLTVNGGSSSSILWAVNFFADKNPGLGTVKHGLAAIGHTTNDVWNGCSRDGATMFDFLTFVAVTNLVTVDGVVTEVDMTLTNAPGAWFNGTDDAMYNTYLYPFDGGNLVVEVSSLPAGAYDFYVYGHGNVDQGGMHDLNGVYQLSSGGVDYGTKSTATNGTIWQTTNWTEGEQYVVFRGVLVAGTQKVVLTGLPGVGGEALIAGLQIQSAGGPVAIAPVITNQPASQTVAVGATVNFNVGVSGTAPLSFQWKFNGSNISGATNVSLTLSNAQVSASGNYSVFVSNTAGSTNSSNAVLTVNGGSANILWAVNFFADKNPGLGTVKHGLAAIGHTTNDVWNGCSRDGATMFDFLTFVAVTNLMTVDGVVTEVDLTLTNAPGAWFNGTDDAMYNTYLYPFDGSNLVVEVSSLPAGAYDFYVYGHGNVDQGGMHDLNGVYQLSSGGVDYGTKSTATIGTIWQTTNWTEGEQYVVFRGVLVAGGQKVVLTGLPGVGGEALIAGLQIQSAGGPVAIVPVITNQPASQTVAVGATVNFNVGVSGTSPFNYQWKLNGTNILGATNTSLTLSNVQLSTAGNYSVFVSNIAGSTNSSNAVLTVTPNCAAAPSGLVSWWSAEGNGKDSVGGNDGSIQSNVTFVAGRVGQAFSFPGNGANVAISQTTGLPRSNITMEVWFKRASSTIISSNSTAGVIFAAGFQGFGLHLQVWEDGTLEFGDVGPKTVHSTRKITDTAFHHLAVTRDGSNNVVFYVDGVSEPAQPLIITFAVEAPATIGCRLGGVLGFLGVVDELSIYNRALSGAEVQAIYAAGSDGKCQVSIPPVITSQPTNQTVPVGANSTFNVVATGTPPLSYQWKFNGSNISGATNVLLTLSNVQLSASGNYSVFVSNPAGSTNSSNAVLTVNPLGPSCVTPPAGVVSWWAAESNANDSVGINHGLLKNGAGFNTGQVGQAFSINGVNQYVEVPPSASFNPPGSFTLEAWIFPQPQTINRCIMGKWSDTGDYANSRCFILTVTPVNALGFGISDAAHQEDTTFHTFDTTNNAIATNVWTHVAAVYDQSTGVRRMYINGVNVANRTNTPITVLNANIKLSIGARMSSSTAAVDFFAGRIDEASMYHRALSGSEIQAIYSAGASGKCPAAPAIVSQPQNQTIFASTSVGFAVSAGGSAPLGYQWRFNGTNLSGATNASLSLSNVQLSQAGSYSVLVSNSAGSTNSSNALLTVLSPGSCFPPPANLVAWWTAEGNANDVSGTNNGVLKNGAGFTTGEVGQAFNLNGVNQYVEVPPSPAFNPSGSFTVEAWIYPLSPSANRVITGKWADAGDYQNSRCFILTVTGVNALGFGISDAAHQMDGSFHTFDTANNTVPLNAWSHVAAVYDQSTGTRRTYINGVRMATRTDAPITVLAANTKLAIGATMASSTTAEAFFAGRIDEASIYQRALSDTEVLALYTAGATGKCPMATPPLITSQPTNLTVPAGSNATFSVTAIGTLPLNYQWKFNGTNINGGTNASLILSNVQLSTAGNYSVLVINSVSSTNSSNAFLTVTPVGPGCLTPPSGIVSWWPGESNVNDLIGGNAGVLLNGATFAAGEVGQAFSFNGAGAHVRVKDAPNLHFTNAMTLEAWIFPTSVGGGNDHAIIDKWEAVPSTDERSYGLSLGPDGRVGIGVSADSVNVTGVVYSTNVIPANQWSYVVGTYDGTALRIYVNGVSNNSLAYSAGVFPGTNDFGIGAVVGGAASGTSIARFAGLIDEPAVYNRALSAAEIQAIFNAGSSGKCQVLAPPSIVTQPASRTVPAGTNVTINVAAIGATPLGYQWRYGSSNISGATNSSLTLSNVQVSQSGNYSVFVSNVAGSTNSSNAVLVVNPPAPTCLAPPAGIVSWWPGQSNANDLAGPNQGTLVGGAGFDAGKVGQAFSFNGTSQYVRVPNSASLNPTGSFSIETWIYPTNVSGSGIRNIMAKWADSSTWSNQRSYAFAMAQGGVLGFSISDAAHQSDTSFHALITTNNAIASNAWTHVAAVYDQSTGTRRIYINGVNVTNRTDVPITVLNGLADVAIGADLNAPAGGQDFFGGMIDELSFYGRALTTAELVAIYNAGAAGKCQPPVPTSTSLVVVDTVASGIASVPINLTATGSENALGFSVNFNTTLLNFVGATIGSGASGGTFVLNTNSLPTGKLGVGVALPANTTFSPGVREVVKLNFATASVTNTTMTPVTFGDQPTGRQVVGPQVQIITATYSNGIVTIPFLGYEGDVAPRTNGDGTISITDWVQVGRFVAGLDTATITPNEFQRADCAPRSTLGDGVLAVADWVQAGRYSVGLDPLTSAGGPISSGALFNPGGAGNGEGAASTRTITAVGDAGQAGQAFTVPVQLNSLGDENAVGFTATFDPAVLTFTGADLGAGAASATLNVNSDAAGTGVVGIALALPIGSSFASATQELVRLNFIIAPAAKDSASVSFASQPVVQQVADANAETLGATYVNATITVLPVVTPPGPTLNIQSSDGNLVITWPVPASGFQLESTDDLSSGDWNPVTATAVTNAAGVTVTIPTSGTHLFFRLRHP